MKTLLKFCFFLGLFALANPAFSQTPPTPTGTDYCLCLEGIQSIWDECPCDPPPHNPNNNDDDNNPTGEPPTEGGTRPTGGFPTGNFPLVTSWLECFFDPDCEF
ncbi:MAG: hypothetical protein AAFZ63_24490 [Bacteroidota bacterium]